MKIKSRVQLRKSVKNKLLTSLSSSFGDVIDRIADKKLESAMANWFKIIIVDGAVLFFQDEGADKMFPTVKGVLDLGIDSPKVTVDAGAVKFVVNGADIMGPGIVSADPDINEGDLVIIAEETHNKPLAIGRALVSASDMVGKSGKAVKSIHYVGDELWNLEV
ncbi:RNA-binding protein [Methanococcoides methylutens]|uniref:Putative tRNA pseudouridine synthase B n=1 Tax=Methanococcoides methylutens MM1 TaxID=1434104 RepID=A0A0E3X019_METMT|nr:RNA-binding protein [Methanococcoides methylutens]AKB84804.1 putative tRNA pseudouridine synthase B [Methanococcoides methylutens MM1]